jgi:hypothetical protein
MKKGNKNCILKCSLAAAVFSFSLAINACKESTVSNNHIGNQTEFLITDGACGSITFVEQIGYDFISAFKELEKRKVIEFSRYCPDNPCAEVVLEPFEINVSDKYNNIPPEKFFAIRVLDKKTGLLMHSVSEVITTYGDLFRINWCLD